MKRVFSFAALALIGTSLVSTPANAQYNNQANRWNGWNGQNSISKVNNTQYALQAQIDAGLNNGSLTRSEYTKLQNKLLDISNLEARFRLSHGRLTVSERRKLNDKLTTLSADVQKQITDSETRWNNRNRRFSH